jgi:hypothetical protein
VRIKLIIASGAVIVLLAWLLWQADSRGKNTVPQMVVVTVKSAEPISVSQTNSAAVPLENSRSEDELPALILARLHAWDDDDAPALRAARIRQLDALLNCTNMFEIVQSLPPNLTGYAFALPSLRQKLMSNPQAALDWMGSHTNVQSQLLTLLHDWGQTNRDTMQQYLSTLPEGEWKQKVLSTAVNEALSADPVAALTAAIQMNPGPQQTAWLTMSAADWAKSEPGAACQWANQINDPTLREQLLGAIAVGSANTDPMQAADFVLQSVQPGPVLNQSVAQIIWTWALQDPAAAGAWLSQVPEGPMRQSTMANLMSVWGNHDANAATAWVEGLPQGALQMQAAQELLSALPAGSP